jgi:sugar lactone lactonase YvrE
MARFIKLAILIFAGCAAPKSNLPPGSDTFDESGAEPDDTGTKPTETSTDFDCSAPFPQAPFQIETYPIQTQEDFDFSTGGYLVYQLGEAVVGTDKQGTTTVLSPGAAGDPRGVHGLTDGRIVIMSPWDGSIKIVDPLTQGLDILAGGLNTPNGVEVDLNDRIYFTSMGEVGWTEPYGRDKHVIHSFGSGAEQAPNGIALSPDEQRLTVAVPDGEHTNLVTIDLIGPDEWGNVQVLRTDSGWRSALDTDVCGNIYTVDYNTGALWRILPDGTDESLGTLPADEIWGFSAMRFGPGQGGWERDRLYITSRNAEVYEVFIGIPGRRHTTTP